MKDLVISFVAKDGDRTLHNEIVGTAAYQSGYLDYIPDPINPNGPSILNPVSHEDFLTGVLRKQLRDILATQKGVDATNVFISQTKDIVDARTATGALLL